MIPRVTGVELAGSHSLRLTFHDGVSKVVNLRPLLQGPIFEPLRDPAYFSQVLLDALAGTVVWPNGADIAPETLYALPDEHEADPSLCDQPAESSLRRSAGAGRVADGGKAS